MNCILRAVAASMVVTALLTNAQPKSPSEANLHVPLDIPLTLSGNFGELRTNHFHSGLDFKTQGRTGLPIYCAADGYVSRIVVSPWGFGRAIYVTHPELGLVTVYGHLQSFIDKIDKPVRDRQYEAESFRIDTEFAPGEIEVKRGELIAHSGNAGSSGGPHLHMDVRDASTEYALDPMPYYRRYLKDEIAPEVRGIALYPREGVVDGKARPSYHTTKVDMAKPFTAWGRVSPAIKAYDKMTGTTNIYGIKYMTLLVDGDTLYHRIIDHSDFNRTRAVNTLVEFGDVVDSNSWYMTTYVPESQPLSDIVSAKGDGTIDIDTERDYKLKFILRDDHGNKTVVPFTIKGKRSEIPAPVGDGELIIYDRQYTVTNDNGASITIPARALYEDCIFSITDSQPLTGEISRRYKIGDKHVPVASDLTITLPLESDPIVDKQKYTLVRVDGKTPSAVNSTYKIGGEMTAKVNRFGTYTVMIDSVPPTVSPVNIDKWRAQGRVTVKISDKLSGIAEYRGEINGIWIMLELDGKTGTLSYKLDPARLPKANRYQFKLTVTDQAGNISVLERIF